MHHHATPLIATLEAIALVSGPTFGLASAARAPAVVVTRTRGRMLWLPAAIPAVVGGIAYAIAAPLTLGTGDPAFTVLFPGVAGVALWYLIAGIAFAVSARRKAPVAPRRPEAVAA